MAANESRGGRPSKLTPELADRLVALLAGGATVTAVAAAVCVDRRTIQQ
jgi:Helix-turn-helix domain of resolvase